jgi:putative endonuclease
MAGNYFVYIMSNASKTLYIGVTNNLDRRLYEHREKISDSFTKKYNITKLVYYEQFGDIKQAIQRETSLKGWLRKKKVDVITSMNPLWKDLSAEWNVSADDKSQAAESSDSSLHSE